MTPRMNFLHVSVMSLQGLGIYEALTGKSLLKFTGSGCIRSHKYTVARWYWCLGCDFDFPDDILEQNDWKVLNVLVYNSLRTLQLSSEDIQSGKPWILALMSKASNITFSTIPIASWYSSTTTYHYFRTGIFSNK